MTDLQGQTISPPPAGALQLRNGTVNGDLTLRSGSDVRNVTVNGRVLFDQDVDGINLSHSKLVCIDNSRHWRNVSVVACEISCGIGRGRPFTGIYCGYPGDNIVITDNLIYDCHEGVHFYTDANGIAPRGFVLSYNEIRGIQRHGLELQCQFQGAVCEGNLIHRWRWNPDDDYSHDDPNWTWASNHMAISWACGPSPDRQTVSRGCVIRGNVFLFDGQVRPPNNSSAFIEAMGYDLLVEGNYGKMAGGNIYTWTNGITSRRNVWVGVANHAWQEEGGGGPKGQVTVDGDSQYALNDPDAPPPPKAGPRVTPGVGNSDVPTGGSPVPTPTPTPTPTNTLPVVATAPGQLTVTLPGTPGTLARKSTEGPDPFQGITTVAAGQKSYVDNGPDPVSRQPTLAPTWRYSYQFTQADGAVFTGTQAVRPDAVTPTPTPTPTAGTDFTGFDTALAALVAWRQKQQNK